MKKLISLSLVLIMLFAVMAPVASVSAANTSTPIIYIRGNGTDLYNADNQKIAADISQVSLGDDGEDSKSKIIETATNILIPFVTEGLIFDKWDNYGKALYDELSPLLDEAILDGDGNPRYGTGIGKAAEDSNTYRSNKNYINKDGTYNIRDYSFTYDWRLDPFYNADLLHTFIKSILKATGASQVSIVTRCLGGVVLNAYLQRYGKEGLVKNALYGDTLASGCSPISKGFSGQVKFDSENLQRYEGQLIHCADLEEGVGFAIPALADEIIQSTLNFFNQIGATDKLLEPIETLYSKLYKALIPALFQSFGYGSMPAYWATVYEEDFDLALEVMFGKKGSEARTYYAGLIEKITYYRDNVTSQLPELYKKFAAPVEEGGYGVHIGTVSKYGYVNPPAIEGSDALNDATVDLADASLGATTAIVGRTLSDSYIADRVAEGKGKYISFDKQVDTSTCVFPETSWIIKNQHHSFGETIFEIAFEFCNGTNVTVETSSFPRFIMFDEQTETWTAMTEDNCADFEFITLPSVEEPTKESIFVAAMRWFTTLFKVIGMLLRGEISFGEAKEIL